MTEAPRRIQRSLLERAAQVYDFEAHLRAREDAPPEYPSPEYQPGIAFEASPEPAPYRSGAGRSVAIDRDLLAERQLLIPGAAIGPLAEEFRQVKRHLLMTAATVRLADADRSRTMLVCSPNAREGKTYCAVNLAISMAAERDVEVLLVDADFAKPDVMARLGVEDGTGLLDALGDPSIDIESCVVATDIPHLSLLPAGAKSNADTELLASKRTDDLIAALLAADPRRIVIFDTPPALAASPAAVLAAKVGQVLFVVRADTTSENELRDAVSLFEGGEHIQLMMNAVRYTPGGRRFGSYYGQEDSK